VPRTIIFIRLQQDRVCNVERLWGPVQGGRVWGSTAPVVREKDRIPVVLADERLLGAGA